MHTDRHNPMGLVPIHTGHFEARPPIVTKEQLAGVKPLPEIPSTPLYIVSVMVFRIEDSKRRAHLHLVAAHSSREAEARIKESSFDRAHLEGRAFINTDEHLRDHGTALRFYSTAFKNDDNISDVDFERWVRTSTKQSRSDGEVHAAAFREVNPS